MNEGNYCKVDDHSFRDYIKGKSVDDSREIYADNTHIHTHTLSLSLFLYFLSFFSNPF